MHAHFRCLGAQTPRAFSVSSTEYPDVCSLLQNTQQKIATSLICVKLFDSHLARM